jgi:aminoglycoside 2'-N-acetyltransferase I
MTAASSVRAVAELVVVESSQMRPARRLQLRALWERAFGDRFTDDDADHAYGGVHVLVDDAGSVIGHASAVPRTIRFGDDLWRTVGYVEAVAVDPGHQGRGIGRAIMHKLHAEITLRWPVALLSTGTATEFYKSLGWEQWRGLSYTLTEGTAVADGEHEGIMVLRIDGSAVRDLSVDVTCENRSGDAW